MKMKFLNLTGRIAYSAVDQILNDNFFQNPAELSLVKQKQLIVGNVFIAPNSKFIGVSSGHTGSATSKTSDFLPYMLGAYRINNRFTLGINITPSALL